jgi:hypothetical protein
MNKMPSPSKRKFGYYWIKPKNEEWGVYLFGKSWGIYGWWGAGEEMAIYDRDIELFGDYLPPPSQKKSTSCHGNRVLKSAG